MTDFVLTLTCPDRPGIVHAVSGALVEAGANIVENAQFGDVASQTFCLRTVFAAAELSEASLARAIGERLDDPDAVIHVRRLDHRPRVMILVSKHDHCLVDLLYRWRTGALPILIPVVVSNHPDCENVAVQNGIEFVHLPVDSDTKARQEEALRELMARHRIDLVVLARYMQVLSDEFCADLPGRVINIHHSFLPGFKGARPYHQAHERGVKLIGATAHFVTAELDEGPIIEQDVVRVTHSHSVQELTRLGQDVERMVLSRAVRYWAEDRVLLVGDKTVVFT